jgi:hypothetical protein
MAEMTRKTLLEYVKWRIGWDKNKHDLWKTTDHEQELKDDINALSNCELLDVIDDFLTARGIQW